MSTPSSTRTSAKSPPRQRNLRPAQDLRAAPSTLGCAVEPRLRAPSSLPCRMPDGTRSRADTPYASRTAQSVVTSSRRRGDRDAVSGRRACRVGVTGAVTPSHRVGALPGGRAARLERPAVQHGRESRRQRRQWRAGCGDVGPVGSSPMSPPLASRSTTTVPTSPWTLVPYRRSTADPARGAHGRSGAPLQRARRR